MGSLLKFAVPAAFVILCSVAALSDPNEEATPGKTKNWGMYNTRAHSHIMGFDALRLTRGSRDVIVAVIDTGVDSHHEFLTDNMWHDRKIANTFGWNFVSDKANPIDDHGHGTHVAGIIHQVSPLATILPIKYYSDANPGSVNLRNTVKALYYAIEHNAKIINYSGGGPEFNEEEYLAIKLAEAKGILIVAAAGNEHQNTDLVENYYYPSAYRINNIISVAATDINNNFLASSNWGKDKVDVTAPGENIYSSLPGNRWGYMSGTSMAAPFVSGIAAQLWACNPKLTYVQVKSIIMSTVDRFPQQKDKTRTGGRVNAFAALKVAAKMNGGYCK